ncbi:MAG: DUF2283 domain-containing protein [Alphaproteobacteria bacterium]|nr:DUF2283 domain-containing protein [Alphaproteobacteria bacterium]
MKFNYDKETDSLYIDFIDGPGSDTVIITDDIVADIDAQGRLVGLDIQHASRQSDLGNFFVEGMTPVLRPAT